MVFMFVDQLVKLLMGYEERSLVMKVVADVVKNKLKASTQLVAQIGGLNFWNWKTCKRRKIIWIS